MNKVILAGRLTRDAEIRNADSDKKIARCTLAINKTFKHSLLLSSYVIMPGQPFGNAIFSGIDNPVVNI